MNNATNVETLSGTLSDFPLKDLLYSLASKEKTGLLGVGQTSEIWLNQGSIYLVRTPQSPRLTEVIFNADIGSIVDIEEMFASDNSTGYVSDQAIAIHPESENNLARILHEYNLKGLFELLVPSDLEFYFESDRKHKLGFRFSKEAKSLVIQAEHRLDLWRKIASAIPSTEAIFTLNKELPAGQAERIISADEWQFVSRLDGKTTIAEIARQTGEGGFRVCSTLYRLLLEGIVTEIN